jgi:hypothetical protein
MLKGFLLCMAGRGWRTHTRDDFLSLEIAILLE